MGKVFKNGNSLAVTVPKSFAHQINISHGSSIQWEKTDKGLLLKSENHPKKPTEIDPEVIKLVKKISKKYSQVWADLAKV